MWKKLIFSVEKRKKTGKVIKLSVRKDKRESRFVKDILKLKELGLLEGIKVVNL